MKRISTISPGLTGEYSSEATYDVGDYVLYMSAYWRCTAKITTPEGWTPGHWEKEEDLLNIVPYKTKKYIDDKISDLDYKEIAITSFSVSTPSSGNAEVGSTQANVVLSWALNKEAAEATLNGTAITLSGTSGTITKAGVNLKNDFTWNLVVKDSGSPSKPAHTTNPSSASLTFKYKKYYGVSTDPGIAAIPVDDASDSSESGETLIDDFLLGRSPFDNWATKEFGTSSEKGKTFTVTAGPDQYIWYAVPESWGACTFKVGGFDGGFSLVKTYVHTNASGGSTRYNIYRSDNANLGKTTVTVS